MIEITELDDLLNILETSALEPHDEYKMEFTNKDQRIIHEYIKSLQKDNQQLKEELNTCMIERNKFLDIIEKAIEYTTGTYEMALYTKSISLCEDNVENLLEILNRYKGDNNE